MSVPSHRGEIGEGDEGERDGGGRREGVLSVFHVICCEDILTTYVSHFHQYNSLMHTIL